MENKDNKKKAIKIWAGAVVCFMFISMTYQVNGLILFTLVDKLGVTYEKLSMTYSFISGGMLIATFAAGTVCVRVSGKVVGMISAVCVAANILAQCFSTSLIMIYIGGLLFGFGNFLGFMYLNTMSVMWFEQGSATMLGLGNGLASAGAAISSPVLASMTERIGVSAMGTRAAIFFFVCMAAAAVFLCGSIPEKYGMTPARVGKKKAEEKQESADEVYESVMPLGRAARSSVFILVAVFGLLAALANNMFSTNYYPIYEELGMGLTQTATFVSVGMVFGTVGPFLYGVLFDWLGMRKTFIGGTIMNIIVFSLAFIIGGFAGAVVCSLTQLTLAYSQVRPAVILKNAYGAKKSSELISWDGLFVTIGMLFAGPLSARIAAATGSYKYCGFVVSALYFVCLIIVFYVTSDKAKQHIKEIDAPYAAKETGSH